MVKRKYPIKNYPLTELHYEKLKKTMTIAQISLNYLKLDEDEKLYLHKRELLYPISKYEDGIRGSIWMWSQIYGKRDRKGIEYWSDTALTDFLWRIENGKPTKDRYNEDHAVTRKRIIEELTAIPKEEITFERIWDYYVDNNVGVHIFTTDHDHIDMSHDFHVTRNVWERYKDKVYKIVRVVWENKKIIKPWEEINKHDATNKPTIVPYHSECKYILDRIKFE